MITQEYLKQRLHYNPETGLFTYVISLMQMRIGDIAGRPNTNGHIQISIDYVRYMAHNLAWLYMTGEYPVEFIVDHQDTIKSNNKWINLRKANLSQNQGNVGLRVDNKSGFKGVHFDKRKHKFIAQITLNNKRTYLGARNTDTEAYDLYVVAAAKHFGIFHRDHT